MARRARLQLGFEVGVGVQQLRAGIADRLDAPDGALCGIEEREIIITDCLWLAKKPG